MEVAYQEASLHRNVLELKAAFLAIKVFAAKCSHCHVRIMMDSMTAVTCINRWEPVTPEHVMI